MKEKISYHIDELLQVERPIVLIFRKNFYIHVLTAFFFFYSEAVTCASINFTVRIHCSKTWMVFNTKHSFLYFYMLMRIQAEGAVPRLIEGNN